MFDQVNLECLSEAILINYGIELKWAEIAALKQYLIHSDSDDTLDAEFNFMLDYFGIDTFTVGDAYCPYLSNCDYVSQRVGMNLLGTESFREYCKRRVSFWREQRELI